MRSDGAPPTRLVRLAGPGLAIVALLVLPGVAIAVDAPTQGNGTAGNILVALTPILILLLAVAVVVLAAAVIVLLRTRGSAPSTPTEGWWTCANCGAVNIDGAARCRSCTTWRATTPRATTPRPTPTASP